MHLAKRYYDMAASASVDAHVPTMLANAKLVTKLHLEWLIQFYKVSHGGISCWYIFHEMWFEFNVQHIFEVP